MIEAPAMVLREARDDDAPACARILQDWLDATPWMPDLHALEETIAFMRGRLFADCRVTVVEASGAVAGYLALDAAGEVRSLTVAEGMRGRGIGARLLQDAVAARPAGLELWTFEANAGARRFYARHGFREIARTPGDNDEGLPDIRLRRDPGP